MSNLRRAVLGFLGVVIVSAGTCAAMFVRGGPDPCAEPSELPATRERVVQCVERYVLDQWYTARLGKLGALDSDPHGQGSWFELARTHRGTLHGEVDALCTHARDEAGALGFIALFAPASASGECRAFSVTPLLSVSTHPQACEAVRAQAKCSPRPAMPRP